MGTTLEQPANGDVVDVLLAQHQQIRDAMAEVTTRKGSDKAAAFAYVVELLERHERAEQQVVHPITRDDVDSGEEIAQESLSEEHNADEAMAELARLDVNDPLFDERFAQFRQAVLAHAAHEEAEEFPGLRMSVPSDVLVKMADDLIEAERM